MDNSPLGSVDDHYKALIVGGGIVGAGIFRDLSMHQVPCLLIDKNDFASQTSNASSKMLHGGIRYLEHFDFALVREALYEKNLWLKLAPHLCYEEEFYLPVYKDSIKPLWMIRSGLILYDLLSGFKNKPHRMVSVDETLLQIPYLRTEGLKGAGIYHDAIVDDAKLTLEVIFDALSFDDANALNYVELVDVKRDGTKYVAELRDTLTGAQKVVRADNIVIATGPFSDRLLNNLSAVDNWSSKLLPSRGAHLWFSRRNFRISHPALITPSDNRVIFVIPQGDRVLVGTTEKLAQGNLFDLHADDQEINYLMDNVNYFFPKANLKQTDIVGTFAGIRPLIMEGDDTVCGETTREHKIFFPQSNFYVVIGGKYTTFRPMGQQVSRRICLESGISYNSNLSKSVLKRSCVVRPFRQQQITPHQIREILRTEKVRTIDDLVKRRLGIPTRKLWKGPTTLEDFFRGIESEILPYIHGNSIDLSNI